MKKFCYPTKSVFDIKNIVLSIVQLVRNLVVLMLDRMR